jgi:hypothetical protein
MIPTKRPCRPLGRDKTVAGRITTNPLDGHDRAEREEQILVEGRSPIGLGVDTAEVDGDWDPEGLATNESRGSENDWVYKWCDHWSQLGIPGRRRRVCVAAGLEVPDQRAVWG